MAVSDRQSIWTLDSFLPMRPALRGDCKTDAAVIGGGLAGILTAYFLQQRGVRVVVLEAGRTGHGQTGNSTAKISIQHGLIYQRLLRDFGEELTRQYAEAQRQAVGLYRHLAGGIDCGYREAPSYLYTRGNPKGLERELRAAERLWIPASYTETTELPFGVTGALRFANQAEMHPLRFLQGLAGQLMIFENTRVHAVDGERIYTENGIVYADQIVIATHYPVVNVPGYYFLRMYQERSYVAALRGAQRLEGMYTEAGGNGLSLRGHQDLVLLEGGSHRTGEHPPYSCYEGLRSYAREIYPKSVELRSWSGQDCVTVDGLPYIGQYSPKTPGLYVATGFGRWGMTNAMAAAVLLSDSICGVANECADIFSPRRFRLRAAARGLCRDQGSWFRGMTLGFAKEGKGRPRKCPHLGCRMRWNPDERSWDCPCHGTRVGERGELLNGPATRGS